MLELAGRTFKSRLLLGTSRYPSPDHLRTAVQTSLAEILTVSLRRQSPETMGGGSFWALLKALGRQILPNTAGCHNAREAVSTAKMARDLFETHWIKVEVIGDDYTLQPDPFGLVEAAGELVRDGFEVFPYTTGDLVLATRLRDLGCRVLMPWAAPIGSGQGILNPLELKTLRSRFPELTLIVDAGIGRPSHAAEAMEMGFDAVLLNTAIATAGDPVGMAEAFRLAVESGRKAYEARPMEPRETACPSTPVVGTPFWHKDTRP